MYSKIIIQSKKGFPLPFDNMSFWFYNSIYVFIPLLHEIKDLIIIIMKYKKIMHMYFLSSQMSQVFEYHLALSLLKKEQPVRS